LLDHGKNEQEEKPETHGRKDQFEKRNKIIGRTSTQGRYSTGKIFQRQKMI
jgi:hypothetical protein